MMLFFDQSSTKKFLAFVLIGFSFSIAVILSTMGLMDGFDVSLRQGLRQSAGEVIMLSQNGFFPMRPAYVAKLKENGIQNYSQIVQIESFLIFEDESRGVIVKGVDDQYANIVGLDIHLDKQSVAIGSEIAKINKIKVGDEVVLVFGKGNQELKGMPALHRFKVSKIINHGVYQKDSRLIYARIKDVQQILELENRINTVSFNVPKDDSKDDFDRIENKMRDLRMSFREGFYFRPYWREFSSLIEAVKAEKVLISLILQIIVVISIFNVLAFIIFINEKKSKELFLFKALGLSKKAMGKLWLQLVGLIWLTSCPLAYLMVKLFGFLILTLPFFELPSEIYYMPRIHLHLAWTDYAFVFLLALFWVMLITFALLNKLRRKSLLEGLRQEFA
jgi:ABC-type lipoprotein release transport system permease subunit